MLSFFSRKPDHGEPFRAAEEAKVGTNSARKYLEQGADSMHPAELLVAAIEFSDIALAAAKANRASWEEIEGLYKNCFAALEATSKEVFWSWTRVRRTLPQVSIAARIVDLQDYISQGRVVKLASDFEEIVYERTMREFSEESLPERRSA